MKGLNMTTNRKRLQIGIGLIILLVLSGVCFGVWAIVQNLTMSPLRKALPSTAQDIREWYWDEGGLIPQDYMYLLRAEISEQEFYEYVAQLGLMPYRAEPTNSFDFYPQWYFSPLAEEQLEWWTPTNNSEGAYIYAGESWWYYAKYENGYVYVVSFNI